ncbi:Ion-translocating oxidoreductase complex subunit B [Candidatus Lokiarchaeum ossiferum]
MMAENNNIYRKLQQRLDKLPIGYPSTESGSDIDLLKMLFTPEEAEITIHLKLAPENLPTIIKRLQKHHISIEGLESTLDSLGNRGLITSHINRSGVKYYAVTFLAIGIFEFQVNRMTKEFYVLFKKYLDEAFRDEILQTKIPQLRTIPTEGSIAPDLPISTYDDIRAIINEYTKPIAVANCICKQGEDLLGHPCKVTKNREICLVFGSAARSYVQKGWGRMITKDECKTILINAEKDGLVVQPSNTQKLFAICLCCGCCCEILTSAKPLDNPVQYFATNYHAIVHEDLCIGCGRCKQRCQMDAIQIVDKKSIVDYTRCIGCGICVPTCPKEAIVLERNKKVKVPPKNSAQLYLNILKKKVGNAKFMLMLTKQLLGNKM